MSYHRARVGSDKGNARGEHRRIWRFWLQVGIWEGGGENQREESTHQSPERVQNLLRVWQGGILEDVGGIQWHTTTVRAIHTQPKKHACGHAVQHTLLHRRTHKDSLSLSFISLFCPSVVVLRADRKQHACMCACVFAVEVHRTCCKCVVI